MTYKHAFIWGHLKKLWFFLCFITILVMSQILERLTTLPQYVMWMTNELLTKIWSFRRKFRWSLSPSKLKGPHELIFGRFHLFLGASNQCKPNFFFPTPFNQVVHNYPKKNQNPPKLGITCEKDWFLHLGSTWYYLPKLTIPTYWKKILRDWSQAFYYYFGHMVVGSTLPAPLRCCGLALCGRM